LSYRSQWDKVQKGYRTSSFNILYPLFIGSSESNTEIKNKPDMGFCGQNYIAGAYNVLDFSFAFGYNKQLYKSHYVSAALICGYVQKLLDYSKLTFNEQYVAGSYNASNSNHENILNKKTCFADVGFGAVWYYNPGIEEKGKINSYIGVSGYHLNQPNESFVAGKGILLSKFNFIGGIKIPGKNKIDFTPNIRYSFQGTIDELAYGFYLDYRVNKSDKFSVGLWYKNNDAFTYSICIERKLFAFSYSLDVVTSEIAKYIGGLNTNEVTLSVKFNRAEKKNIRFNPSPFSSF
ncbi:MAG: PorP/SprF family type IX secretion system membrane protein, partial [Bacteroidales bacterium]|nr:PorP/SprF family type IX secretion system membrane protein [Bacteroidales bacterium]